MTEEITHIISRCDNAVVDARLLAGIKPHDLLLIERAWTTKRQHIMQQLLASHLPRHHWPQSLHWDWSKKANALNNLGIYGWAIECQGDWQGVLLVDTASHFADLEHDRGKPLVYIDYLETAPWNWTIESISQQGTYKGVGQTLFQKAIQHSSDEGFHGRVGLHALPQAEGFYELACGMTRFAKDPGKQNLVYFELSREVAKRRLLMEEK